VEGKSKRLSTHFFDTAGYDFTILDQNFCREETPNISFVIVPEK